MHLSFTPNSAEAFAFRQPSVSPSETSRRGAPRVIRHEFDVPGKASGAARVRHGSAVGVYAGVPGAVTIRVAPADNEWPGFSESSAILLSPPSAGSRSGPHFKTQPSSRFLAILGRHWKMPDL